MRPPWLSAAGTFVLSAAPPPVGGEGDRRFEIDNAPVPAPATNPVPSPSAAPTAVPSATPAPGATAAPVSSGGTGGGGNGGARPPNILVVDDEDPRNYEAGNPSPIPGAFPAGATVTFGPQPPLPTTNPRGEIDVPYAIAGPVTVRATGFVPSHITAITPEITTVHLRRAGGASPPFNQEQTRVTGTVADAGTLLDPYVVFANPMRTSGPPDTATAGAFTLDLTRNGIEEPTGVVFVIAGRISDGELMYGASPTIKPFAQGVPRPLAIATPIALAEATRLIRYTATFPAGPLDRTEAALLYHPHDGGPPVVIDSSPAANGTFKATPDGALAGAWRIRMTATDATGDLSSMAIVDPSNGNAVATLLPSPTITAVGPEGTGAETAHRVRWTPVSAAGGYRVEVRRDGIEGPTWEAWTGHEPTVTIPEADWPGPGQGHVIVQAIDAEGVSTRSLASVSALGGPRRLRIEPWTTQTLYKVSTARRRT